MVYPIWEDFVVVPERSLKGAISFPLLKTNNSGLGAYRTRRIKTRAIVPGSVRLKLEGDDFEDIRQFYRDNLFEGSGFFSAQWILDIGYEGYLGKMPSYSTSAGGALFNANCTIELIPHVRVDVNDNPSPFPDEYL